MQEKVFDQPDFDNDAFSSAFSHQSAETMAEVFAGKRQGYFYSRVQNPLVERLETELAELDGGIGAVACASGMAAITNVILALTEPGDVVLAGQGLFGGTYAFLTRWLPRYGIETTFFEVDHTENLEQHLNKKVKLIFCESLGNPNMKIADIEFLVQLAHSRQIPLIIDNTILSPALLKPGEWGCDIVIHSTTKFIDGHGRAIGGCIIDMGNDTWERKNISILREYLPAFGEKSLLQCLRSDYISTLGACLSPYHAFLHLEGLKTLKLRTERQSRNALELAQYLQKHKNVQQVSYPGLKEHAQHDLARKYLGNLFGGVLCFDVGTAEKAFAVLNALKKIRLVANLGDSRTLAIHPASTIYRGFFPPEQEKLGVTSGLIRVSVGIEPVEEIIEDFDQALSALTS